MNVNKLKGKRVENRFTQSDMGIFIEKSTDAYAKKERGETEFTPTEIQIITRNLKLTFEEFNDIFFDRRLPNGKFYFEDGD